MHRLVQTRLEDKSNVLTMFQWKELFFWILVSQQSQEPGSPLFLSQTSLLTIISVLFPRKFCFSTDTLSSDWCQSTWLCQNGTKETWQGKESALTLHVSMCACVCTCMPVTGKKKLVYYPTTGTKRIYPQLSNLLFSKLSEENKYLHLITWTSISVNVQFVQKSAIVYMLFVPNFKIIF